MRFVLFLLAILALAIGLLMVAEAKSALHEIEGLISILIASVLLAGAAVVDQLVQSLKARGPSSTPFIKDS